MVRHVVKGDLYMCVYTVITVFTEITLFYDVFFTDIAERTKSSGEN